MALLINNKETNKTKINKTKLNVFNTKSIILFISTNYLTWQIQQPKIQ